MIANQPSKIDDSSYSAIKNFLIGIRFFVRETALKDDCFLPGIWVDGMTINVDLEKLKHPGDLLHEAGHVAIVPSIFRPKLFGDVEKSLLPIAKEYLDNHSMIRPDGTEDLIIRGYIQAGEHEAMAWSFAAAIACNIYPMLVFHYDGYDGNGESICDRLKEKSFYGLNGMVAAGMTNLSIFPKMIRWLQL